MTTRPDTIVPYDILGLQQRRNSISQQETEDTMNIEIVETPTIDLYICDELEKRAPRFQRKDPNAFAALIALARQLGPHDRRRAGAADRSRPRAAPSRRQY
jgi:hypothetical protein